MAERLATIFDLVAVSNTGKTALLDFLQNHYEDLGLRVARVKYPVYRPEGDHGVTDMDDIGKRINAYIREGNPEKWNVNIAQHHYALNRFNFDPQIVRWQHTKDLVLREDGKWTSIIWGPLMDSSVTKEHLIRINDGLVEPDISVTLRGPRLGGVEPNHVFEQSGIWQHVMSKHVETAKELEWRIIDFEKVEGEDGVKKEIARVGGEMIKLIDDKLIK